MKGIELTNIYGLLSRMKLNKVSDKETRNGLISNHLKLYKIAKGFDEDIQELRKKYFEGKDEEVKAYTETLDKIQTATGDEKAALEATLNPEMISLAKEFNEAVFNYQNKEVEFAFTAVPVEGFTDALVENDVDFSMADIRYFIDCGLVKE